MPAGPPAQTAPPGALADVIAMTLVELPGTERPASAWLQRAVATRMTAREALPGQDAAAVVAVLHAQHEFSRGLVPFQPRPQPGGAHPTATPVRSPDGG